MRVASAAFVLVTLSIAGFPIKALSSIDGVFTSILAQDVGPRRPRRRCVMLESISIHKKPGRAWCPPVEVTPLEHPSSCGSSFPGLFCERGQADGQATNIPYELVVNNWWI